MGIIQSIINKLPTLRNTQNTQYIKAVNRNHPITTYRNLHLYYEASKNNTVYRCNEVYKNTALACNFTIDTDTTENDNPATTKYLDRLFHQPGGYHTTMTWSDTNSLIWDSLNFMGDCFFEISTDEEFNILNGFQYIHNDSIQWNNENDCYQLTYQPNVLYEPNDLIHIRRPDIQREQMPWGVSIISRCAEWIALMSNAIGYNNEVLLNDGLNPHTILSFDKDISDHNMTSELNRLRIEKEQGKRGGLLALRGATLSNGAATNKDMSYLELMKFARDNIVQTFGVPPQLIGIIETANLGSGSGDSQKKDWKITFNGASSFVEDAFNNTLKNFGFSERFHYQQMDVVDELYDAQVNQIYIQNGIKTIDEIRNELGLDKLQQNEWQRYYS